jgi:hypothetical protein
MNSPQVFEVEEVNGKQYVTTEARGVRYTLAPNGDGWAVYTKRLGYGGRFHMGGCKMFDTLQDVANKCRAFADFYAMEAA